MTIGVRNPGELPNVYARVENARALLANRKLDDDTRAVVDSLVALASTQHELNKRLWEALRGLPFGVMDAIDEAGGIPGSAFDHDQLNLHKHPHAHAKQDVEGAAEDHDRLHLHKHPHTHAKQDVEGALVDHDQLNLHKHPHTHIQEEIVGPSPAIVSVFIEGVRPLPHTHEYSSLVGTQFLPTDGTAALPLYSFRLESGMGLYRSGAAVLGFATQGTARQRFGATNHDILSDSGNLRMGVNLDTRLLRIAAGVFEMSPTSVSEKLAIKAGSAQALNLQEWQDSAGTPLLSVSSAGFVNGGAAGAGILSLGGSRIDFYLSSAYTMVLDTTSLRPNNDAAFDFGSSTKRWRRGYFGGAGNAVGLNVMANAAQSVNMQEWQNSAGTPLSAIDKDGNFTGTIQPMQVVGPPKPHSHDYADLRGNRLILGVAVPAAVFTNRLTDNNGNLALAVGITTALKSGIYVADNFARDSNNAHISADIGNRTNFPTQSCFNASSVAPVTVGVQPNAGPSWLIRAETTSGANGFNTGCIFTRTQTTNVLCTGDAYAISSNNYMQGNGTPNITLRNFYGHYVMGTHAVASPVLTNHYDFFADSYTGPTTGLITNRYALYINFSDSGITNAWGVYQVSSTLKNFMNGSLGIGISPTSKLHVAGSADVVQVAVKANASQTVDIQEWQDSAGNVLSRIDKNGQTTDFVLAGQIFGF